MVPCDMELRVHSTFKQIKTNNLIWRFRSPVEMTSLNWTGEENEKVNIPGLFVPELKFECQIPFVFSRVVNPSSDRILRGTIAIRTNLIMSTLVIFFFHTKAYPICFLTSLSISLVIFIHLDVQIERYLGGK